MAPFKTKIIWIAVLTAGCAQPGTDATGASNSGGSASAVLRDATGREVGTARVRQVGDGVQVSLQGAGLTAGTHGAHLHAVGRCDPPDFASAGPHWNPTGRQHGKDNPAGMHKGDLPNLTIGSDGRGNLESSVEGSTLADLLDADGTAVVVHATADDYRTDPSGNSGGRIACGVLTAS